MGIGIDIVEVARIEKAITRFPRFLHRVFTAQETSYISSYKNKAERAAGFFAAKEASVKAAGGHISDYEIFHTKEGKPYAVRGEVTIEISISHEKKYAIAMAKA